MTFHYESGSHPNKSGDYNIYLSISHCGERKRVKTQVSVPIKFWDVVSERVRKGCPSCRQANDSLQKMIDRARSIELDLLTQGKLTMLRFMDRFQCREQSYMLLSYFHHIRSVIEQEKKWGTFKKYGDAINKLTDYIQTLGIKDVDFRDITPQFISGYTAYLQSLPNQRNTDTTLSPNSVAKHLKVLRAILNRAVDDNIIHPYDIPRKLISVREKAPSITGLRDGELDRLMKLPIKDKPEWWNARNAWMFAMYEGGIRIADIIQLRWANIVENRLVYTMNKNGKKVDVILVPDALKILKLYRKTEQKTDEYIFPYLDSKAEYAKYIDYEDRKKMPQEVSRKLFTTINAREAKIGKVLREIRTLVGIPHLTFHTARHTFALRAKDANIDNTTLKNIMQHSSLNTTELYMKKLDRRSEDEAMKQIYLDKTQHNRKKRRIVRQIKKLGISTQELMELLAGE